MKSTYKLLLPSLVLCGLALTWTGCVGVVGGRGDAGHYGNGPWYRDGLWLDGGGRGWYGGHGGGAYVHPSGGRGGSRGGDRH